MEGVPQPPDWHPKATSGRTRSSALRTSGSPRPSWRWQRSPRRRQAPHDGDHRPHPLQHPRQGRRADRDRSLQAPQVLDRRDREIAWLVGRHMFFKDLAAMRKATLKRLIAHPWFNDLIELHRADALGGNSDLSAYDDLRRMREESPPPPSPAPLIDGKDLIALGLAPAPVQADPPRGRGCPARRPPEDAQRCARVSSASTSLSPEIVDRRRVRQRIEHVVGSNEKRFGYCRSTAARMSAASVDDSQGRRLRRPAALTAGERDRARANRPSRARTHRPVDARSGRLRPVPADQDGSRPHQDVGDAVHLRGRKESLINAIRAGGRRLHPQAVHGRHRTQAHHRALARRHRSIRRPPPISAARHVVRPTGWSPGAPRLCRASPTPTSAARWTSR